MEPVVIDYEICNKDGICTEVCPRKLIVMKEGAHVPIDGIDNHCIRCGHCLAVCPKGAIWVYNLKPVDCPKMDKKQSVTHDQLDHLLRSRRSIRMYKHRPIRHASGIPADHRLYGTMVVGYPKYAYQRIPERNPSQVLWLWVN